MRCSLALLAVTAATAAAAPAQAADLSLDVMAHGTITVNSSAADGVGNSETVDASVDLEHQISGLYLAEGARETSSPFEYQRLFATSIGAHKTMQTPKEQLKWDCSAIGEAAGAAGDVRVRRDDGDLLVDVTIQQSLEGNTRCTGASEHGSSYVLMNAPIKSSFRVPPSALADGHEILTVRKLPVTCLINGHCTGSFSGSVVLDTQDDAPAQQPTPPGSAGPTGPATPAGPGQPAPADPAKPVKPATPKVKAKRTRRGAKVTVTCGAGCGGRISALSVARSKQLTAKTFKTEGSSTKVVVLRFPKHTRGGVIINVRATPRDGSAATRTVRLGR